MKRYIPTEQLTPTEAGAEGAIRRDPLRRESADRLHDKRAELQRAIRFYDGTNQDWRVPIIEDEIVAIDRELKRRRVVE